MSKNCILYLVRTSEEDLISLNKSLRLVEENVLPNNPGVDIILFHEESFNFMKSRVHLLPNTIFQLVTFPEPPVGTPEIFPHPLPEQIALGNLGFSIGYRHMCWFFSGGLYEQPIMADYKYYMRLDTDSYILSPINYDIFKMMEDGGYRYATIREAMQLDHPDVCIGLWDFCWKDTHSIPEFEMFYNNFEICQIDWFAKGYYHYFFKRIEQNGGIYRCRWGDSVIRRLGIGLFMPDEWILYVKGFKYQHGAVYDLTK